MAEGDAEELRRGYTAEQSAQQYSKLMMEAAQTALQQTANSATANIAFSSEGTKVTIDVAHTADTFNENLAKSICRTFHPGSGHGAFLQGKRTQLGKPSTKIRRTDNSYADTREVTSSKTRQELNGLATTELDRLSSQLMLPSSCRCIVSRVSLCRQQQQ
jgi:hypothetical protein